MDLKKQIQSRADELFEQVIANRRHIHMHPELSFEEAKTAAFVQDELKKLDIPFDTDIGGHGVLGYLIGTADSPNAKTIALRADMDALPITEENTVPYKSQNQGIMHACGHDVHTSSLLGTAQILAELRPHFAGTIKLLFQPAEERLPGGASLMIKDGALKNPDVGAIFGQHVQPYFPAGKIGVRSGMYMASADEIYMRVIGKGGHAAQPAHFIDPVVMTAQILVALQQVVSRSDPRIPSILSFGRLEAKGATNIIPDYVDVAGTFRTMNEPWRAQALDKIKDITHGIAKSLGGSVELDIRKGYPVLFNDEALTGRTRGRIADYIGEENIIDMDLWMAAEDFAWYTHEVPGCFYRLGTRNEAKGIIHGLHTPHFDIEESTMRLSTGLMAWLALEELGAIH
ncbi:MAG: M20 family metallopeptidase [Bacteroidia bacterium]